MTRDVLLFAYHSGLVIVLIGVIVLDGSFSRGNLCASFLSGWFKGIAFIQFASEGDLDKGMAKDGTEMGSAWMSAA
eukprot:3548472-Amphidinium_carterae.1